MLMGMGSLQGDGRVLGLEQWSHSLVNILKAIELDILEGEFYSM